MKSKKLTVCLAAVLAAGLMGTCMTGYASEQEAGAADTDGLVLLLEQKGDFSPAGMNDGIYIAELTDQYFDGGVEEGMAALLDAGQVYINGIQIPTEEETFYLNGSKGIWQKENGDWTWQVHDFLNRDAEGVVDHDGDYSFDFARRRFVLAATALRGSDTKIYAEEGSDTACRVDIFVASGATVADVTVNDDDTTTIWGTPIDSVNYNTDGGPNDIEERIFPSENVDENLQGGDIAIYWYGDNGWEIRLCPTVSGLLESWEQAAVLDGVTYDEAIIIRTSMQKGDRPSQFSGAYFTFGLTDIPVTLWLTEEDGYIVGISYGENSREALEQAVDQVDAYMEDLTILPSEDGSDIPSDCYWVDGTTWATYYTAYTNAKEVLENEDSTNFEMDAAIQSLCEGLIGDEEGLIVEDWDNCDTGILAYQPGTRE